jgi:predicted  nucleic acid-binding Zn-ribbon protein
MTNEEMQRTMEFIVNQQAQFSTDIQKLQESQQVLQGSLVETNQLLTRLAAATMKGFEDINEKINTLVDAQIRTEENVKKTDEAVRNLTAVVDRYFRERNGG